MSEGTKQNYDQVSSIFHTNATNYELPHAGKTCNRSAKFLVLGLHIQWHVIQSKSIFYLISESTCKPSSRLG